MAKVSFGASKVNQQDKPQLVKDVFSRVAVSYDKMNDVMSFGLHRLWKKFFVRKLLLGKKSCLLDLAGGTGDIARQYIKYGGESSIICDFTFEMLNVGQNLPKSFKYIDKLSWIQGDAESLPIASISFDKVSMVFGLRNTTQPDVVIKEAWRVLRTGGKFLVMEFARPQIPIFGKIYNVYSENVLPLMGKIIAKDENAYNYLQESITSFANKDTVLSWYKDAGFINCKSYSLSGGIVVVYSGIKS